ncbi:hypothetical protein [Mesorhizobium sp. Cs1321R2N1]|uniref:hypothetical protein n=1 Tax=Mesorhizobium sp. Cs1321R2N1 TaxID=3015174 RepID=UPI00301C682C
MDRAFKYTAEQLVAIAETLVVEVDHPECRQVEWIVGEWKVYSEDDVRADLARNAKIANLADQLLSEILPDEFEIDEHFADDGSPVTLAGHLVSLLNLVEKTSDEHPPMRGRRPQIPSALSTRLIEFWENSGRRVSRSSKVNGKTDEQTSTGPLVRFLLAACSPVLVPTPTADAVASAIRTYRKADQRYGEKAIDNLIISTILKDRSH